MCKSSRLWLISQYNRWPTAFRLHFIADTHTSQLIHGFSSNLVANTFPYIPDWQGWNSIYIYFVVFVEHFNGILIPTTANSNGANNIPIWNKFSYLVGSLYFSTIYIICRRIFLYLDLINIHIWSRMVCEIEI